MTQMLQDVFIVSGARTAIGSFGGSLKDVPPTKLGALVLREAITRAGLEGADVGHVVMGQVIQTEPRDMYLARVVAIEAGVPQAVPALTLNRLCGSGVQAIITAAQMVQLGECAIAAAGGAESMSRAPHMLPALRNGSRMADATAIDMLLAALQDPFGAGHMGVTAENVAKLHGIGRPTQDAAAAESHRRAVAAIAGGHFEKQIVAVELKSRKGASIFDTDEHPRAETSLETLSTLKPIFAKDGTVTAGNASGINDGAAALLLASGADVERRGLTPRARIVAWGHAGVDPSLMGLGPLAAVPKALARAGLTVGDLDVIESNEAFAAQACAVTRELEFPPERTNPNGSGISLGHPVGATGAIITVKALYELERTGGRYGLVTMCIGGGQGIALIIERV